MEDFIEENENNLKPTDVINGFYVRPGFYRMNGATAFPNAINFTVFSTRAISCELLLFYRKEIIPYAVIPFPEHYRIGHVYSMLVFGLNVEEFEYAYRLDGPYNPKEGLLFDKTKFLLDPYAKSVTGQSIWGEKRKQGSFYKARVVKHDFDWGNFKQPLIPMEELMIYELHVRGFTKDESSCVKERGTFEGIREKIPYLKELGVNAVEMMPIFEFDEMRDHRIVDNVELIDYWGYNSVGFFAPNTSYSSKPEHNREGTELKQLIKELNSNGIEVILDVVFNHTAEGNENGPFFSFKGFDNNVYYMLTPEGFYYNYSGCGNTLNCNHPIVQQLILECLRYWVISYRVDGFRFDLASILGRDEDGNPMNKPPLLESLAFDPILGNVKLIAEAWDAGGLYQVGNFPSWNRWAEWNGKYRDDVRGFLKGDDGKAMLAAYRIMGSPDLYPPQMRGINASVNLLTCHDGFTLYDLYSYNEKHNEKNGWNNTDGENNNYSWNCGIEGETKELEVINLRKRMIKNACLVLLCSRGTPMFLAGDEFGNTQFGNNNAYCQDNIISWLDWNLLNENKELFEFFKYMIKFRKKHKVILKNTDPCSIGFPSVSMHSNHPWVREFSWEAKVVGIMFAGRKDNQKEDDIIYLAINAFWETQRISLPILPENMHWNLLVNTYDEHSIKCEDGNEITDFEMNIGARSVVLLTVIKGDVKNYLL